MDEQMVAVGGRAFQVSSGGSGPVTLVILSGSNILFPGLEYAPLADALREWYSVLIPSKFGYGFSDLTEAPRDVDTVVEEYRRVLAALKHPFPVVLAAHSMGFLEALHWASKYPEEISALVGLDPATPDAYQNMDLASVLHHLEHLGRPDWKRAILFQLASHSLLRRCPASVRKDLVPPPVGTLPASSGSTRQKPFPTASVRYVRRDRLPLSPRCFCFPTAKALLFPKKNGGCVRGIISLLFPPPLSICLSSPMIYTASAPKRLRIRSTVFCWIICNTHLKYRPSHLGGISMQYKLRTPVTREDLAPLRTGDTVLLSGAVYTARDAAHKRMMELLDTGGSLPFPVEGSAVYYVGPTPERPGQVIGSAGPTTSGRMDAYSPRLLDLGQLIMIGKGKRDQAVKDAVVRNGGGLPGRPGWCRGPDGRQREGAGGHLLGGPGL